MPPVAPARGTAGAAEPRAARTGTLLGRWEGLGRHSNGPTWKMVLTIASLEEGSCATAVYPSLDCSAEWECMEDSDGRTMRAVEHIVRGMDKCIDGGTMTLELSNDGQSVHWNWEDGGSEITAHAKLQRGRAAADAGADAR